MTDREKMAKRLMRVYLSMPHLVDLPSLGDDSDPQERHLLWANTTVGWHDVRRNLLKMIGALLGVTPKKTGRVVVDRVAYEIYVESHDDGIDGVSWQVFEREE